MAAVTLSLLTQIPMCSVAYTPESYTRLHDQMFVLCLAHLFTCVLAPLSTTTSNAHAFNSFQAAFRCSERINTHTIRPSAPRKTF